MTPGDKMDVMSEGILVQNAAADVVPLTEKPRAGWARPLQQVEAYWQAMRSGSNVPSRSDIDPRGIETALEFAFVAERIAPTLARLRIGGTHLCDLMGMEVRGMPLSAMMVPVARDQLARALHQVFEASARAEFSLLAEKRIGKPALSGRMLLLPLTDDFGDVNRLLGCLVSDGTVGRAPRRFEITRCDLSGLGERPVLAAPRRMVPVSLGRNAEFRPGPVPYLRVVKSDID